jgi:hypothetical protein
MSVRLSGNGIDSHGASLVSAALLNPKCSLRSLAIGDNPFDQLAVYHLSQAVISNRMLQMLELRGGAQGRCTGTALIPLLKNIAKYNDTISWLDISGHTLQATEKSSSSSSSSSSVSANPTPSAAAGSSPGTAASAVVDMPNDITAAAAGAAIASLLKRDPRLFPTVGSRIVHLVVANAGLNGKAFSAIAEALVANTSLTHLEYVPTHVHWPISGFSLHML